MTVETKNILIVGVGGQGIILAADIIAQVLVSVEYDVKMAEIHGMSQRGGGVNTMIRFGSKVNSPILEKGSADFVLAFEQLEALRWSDYVKPGGVLIMNTEMIPPLPVLLGKAEYPLEIDEKIRQKGVNLITVEAAEFAQQAGSKKAANMVLTGCLASFMPIPAEIWHTNIERRVPEKTIEINKKAFDLGYELLAKTTSHA